MDIDIKDVVMFIWFGFIALSLGVVILLTNNILKKYSFFSEPVEATVIDKNVTSDVYYINTMPYKIYEMDITIRYENYQLKIDDNDSICKKYSIGDTIPAYIVTRTNRKTMIEDKHLSLKEYNYE